MEPLTTEKYFHIYNHANGTEKLFAEHENYLFFLRKYDQHISPVTDTFAYCLMPNHFHLLVRMKSEKELISLIESRPVFSRFEELKTQTEKECFLSNFLSKQFANLFSSYTQAFNRMFSRQGSLFVKNFKRTHVGDDSYFTQLVQYIHLNPVKHGFVKAPEDWQYSSYNIILSNKASLVKSSEVIDWFDGLENFKFCHLPDQNLYQGSELWKS
jgi:REP element-mobilizing transposase RayT